MGEYTAILKGYTLHVVYNDNSSGTREFGMDGMAKLETELAAMFAGNLDMIQSFTVTRIWSKPGETVSIPMKYQS
jgi:hypothetical protein